MISNRKVANSWRPRFQVLRFWVSISMKSINIWRITNWISSSLTFAKPLFLRFLLFWWNQIINYTFLNYNVFSRLYRWNTSFVVIYWISFYNSTEACGAVGHMPRMNQTSEGICPLWICPFARDSTPDENISTPPKHLISLWWRKWWTRLCHSVYFVGCTIHYMVMEIEW